MKRLLLVTTLLLPIVAHADVCLDLGGVVYVGTGISLPTAGNCRAWSGFVQAGLLCPGGESGMSTGVVCASSGANAYRLGITTTCRTASVDSNDLVYTDTVYIPRPALSGGSDRFTLLDSGTSPGVNAVFDASVVSCAERMGSGQVWVP